MARNDKRASDDSGQRKAETEFVLVGLGAPVGYVLLRQSHLKWPVRIRWWDPR